MKFIRIIILISILSLFSFNFALAQTDEERMEELRRQIEQLEQQAAQYRSGIASEQAEARTLQNEINSLKRQISQIENQISLTGAKINKTEIEIGGLEDNIYNTEVSMDYRKNTIAQLLLSIDKSDAEPLVVSLIKNKNLSDFFRQEQYTKDINTSLLNMVEELRTEKQRLESEKNDLELKKGDLQVLSRNQTAQKVSLSQATGAKNTLLKETKGQEAAYQKMLADVESKKTLFFKELRELETKIIQGGLYLVHITADSNLPKRGTKLFSWPEAVKRITQSYGMTTYAKRGAYGGAPHNGLDMANGFGSEIKAIGDGVIVANGVNSGWGNWVAIQHSNQYNLVSVYAHMSSLSYLRVGTQVKTGQVIGYEGATGNATGSHLHLSIYKDFFTYVKTSTNELYFNYFEGSINPMDYL